MDFIWRQLFWELNRNSLLKRKTPLRPPQTRKHIDRTNGFSLHYPADWAPTEANEEVTKFLIVSPSGNRCWVIVVPNPLSTGANAKSIVQSLIRNKSLIEEEFRKTYADAYVSSVRPVLMSGKNDAALLSYSLQYNAFDISAVIAVLEAHIPVQGFTYKVGCSTVGETLSDEFRSGSTIVFRSFVFIPKSD